MKPNKAKFSTSLFISLDALREDELNDFVGINFDPTFEAAAQNEEWGFTLGGVFSAAQVIDWDDFAIVKAAHLSIRRDEQRKIREVKRNGRPKSKGGLSRSLPDFECPVCKKMFRPQSKTKIFCSAKCASRHRTNTSKTGLSLERLHQATGLSKKVIGHRLMRGWTEERIIKTPLQEKRGK